MTYYIWHITHNTHHAEAEAGAIIKEKKRRKEKNKERKSKRKEEKATELFLPFNLIS